MDLKQTLKFGRTKILGLDIGSSSVKLVQLEKTEKGYHVNAAAIADILETSGGNDEQQELNTTEAILTCLERSGVDSEFAVCSVSGSKAVVRSFNFPPLPSEEIEGAIRLEAEQVCPFNISDCEVDYQLIPDSENKIRGILVAATNNLITSRKHLAQHAGLKSVLMDVDGLALLNCLAGSDFGHLKDALPVAVLNVGGSCVNLAIIGENSVPLVRDIACGGNDIIDHLVHKHNVSKVTVNKILVGEEDTDYLQEELANSMVETFQKLIVDINESLRYYCAREKSKPVNKIFVCGGFSLVKGFVELLESQLSVPVVLWNPFEDVASYDDGVDQEILSKKGPMLAVAAGLAMRSV